LLPGGVALAEVGIALGGGSEREVGHGCVRLGLLEAPLLDLFGDAFLGSTDRGSGLLVVAVGDLVGVGTVPHGLGVAEDDEQSRDSDDGKVEPPEVAPADGLGHDTGDDGGDHERAHVPDPVESVPETTVVKEKHVGDDGRLKALGWTSTNTVEAVRYCQKRNHGVIAASSNLHASAHETAVAVGLCSPDHGTETDEIAADHDSSTTERSTEGYPDEV